VPPTAPAARTTPKLEAVSAEIVACTLCPRLRDYCARIAREKKAAHLDDVYWGKPVPGFGDPAARLLIVGLAPAAHGGNRTGRTFTGDGSGDFLMSALHRVGFASIPTSRSWDDGLRLDDAYILAAVRCAPPDNKPLPEEIVRCRRHMVAEIAALPRVQVIVALGKIGAQTLLRTLDPISKLRGRVFAFRGAKLVPTFHPAYLLRNPSSKREVWEDMKLVRDILKSEV